MSATLAAGIEDLLEASAEDGKEWLTTREIAFWTSYGKQHVTLILDVLEYAGRVESDGRGPRGRGVERRWRRRKP